MNIHAHVSDDTTSPSSELLAELDSRLPQRAEDVVVGEPPVDKLGWSHLVIDATDEERRALGLVPVSVTPVLNLWLLPNAWFSKIPEDLSLIALSGRSVDFKAEREKAIADVDPMPLGFVSSIESLPTDAFVVYYAGPFGAIVSNDADTANDIAMRFSRGNVDVVIAPVVEKIDDAVSFLLELMFGGNAAKTIISIGANQLPTYSVAFSTLCNASGSQIHTDMFAVENVDKVADVLWKAADIADSFDDESGLGKTGRRMLDEQIDRAAS